MTKRTVIGFMAVGAAFGLRPVVRRVGEKLRRHCEQMVAQFGGRGEVVGPT